MGRDDVSMPGRDRTNLFLSISAGLTAGAAPSSRRSARTTGAQSSPAARQAASCKDLVTRVQRELEKLEALQKRAGGVFDDDPSDQIEALSGGIQQDLTEISGQLQALGELGKTDKHATGMFT